MHILVFNLSLYMKQYNIVYGKYTLILHLYAYYIVFAVLVLVTMVTRLAAVSPDPALLRDFVVCMLSADCSS